MRILYLEGDPCSPKYVAGALRHAGLAPSSQYVARALDHDPEGFDLYLLSDYEAKHLGGRAAARIASAVEDGAGLLIAGGWTSLGRGGYARTTLADVIPARMHDGDDRENRPSGLFLEQGTDHPILEGLPLGEPPVITGYNRIEPDERATVVLQARAVEGVRGREAVLSEQAVPILLAARHGRGRVVVMATDPAPHWSGGLTDWGSPTIDVGEGEEVGAAYVRLLAQACAWAASEAPPPLDDARAAAGRR